MAELQASGYALNSTAHSWAASTPVFLLNSPCLDLSLLPLTLSASPREICLFYLPLSHLLLSCSPLLSGVLKGTSHPLPWDIVALCQLGSEKLSAAFTCTSLLAWLWSISSLLVLKDGALEWKNVSPIDFLGNWGMLLMWIRALAIPVSLGSKRVDEHGRDGEEGVCGSSGGGWLA